MRQVLRDEFIAASKAAFTVSSKRKDGLVPLLAAPVRPYYG